MTSEVRQKLKPPILCLVTDREACHGRPLAEVVGAAVGAGAGMVQLRDRGLPAKELLTLGEQLLLVVRAGGALLVVNDRVDVAIALGADGVHLGAGSLPLRVARDLVGDRTLVGASVHGVDEAVRAQAEGADYLIVGTIFATPSHPGVVPAGPRLIAEVARRVAIPVLGIGGIDASNAGQVMAAGASGAAAITAIQSAPDVAGATSALLAAISEK